MSTQIIQQPKATLPAEEDNFSSMIERLACNKDVDVEKLERMMAMQERILDRNARMAFTSALSAMQEDMPEIDQNGEIRHGGTLISKYAKFEDINEAVKPVLQKHGFAISFRIKQPEGKVEVTAILSHKEGHSEETCITLPADTGGAKNAVQAQGSSVKYGQRYAMCALLNINSRAPGEKDDDAQNHGSIDTEKAAEIDLLIVEVGAGKKKFLDAMGVNDVRDIKVRDYPKAKEILEEVRKAVAARKAAKS